MSITDGLISRARAYAQLKGLALGDQLGRGVHGIVFLTECQGQKATDSPLSAIKAHQNEPDYWRERDVYLRLQEFGVNTIRGCRAPELIAYDDTLFIIEMTVVTRPFVLDFAGAYLDHSPDFSEEVLADWQVEKREQFGPRWGEVQAILRALEGFGIYMIDVNPGNISFG